MTPVFAHWAWRFPHLLLLVQLLQCIVGATAAAAGVPPSSLGNTIEADLIFPHEGGRYTNSPNGIPVVIGIQNADAASRFGFKLRWQLLEAPTRRGEVSVMVGGGPYPSLRPGDTRIDVNATAPTSFPWATTAKITGQLSAGNYTLQWNLGVVPYCEFDEQTAKYEYDHEVTRGTLRFAIVDDAAVSPPRSLLSANGDGRDGSEAPPGGRKRNGTENVSDGNGNCANLMGVVSYVSTAPWSRAAETQRWPGDPRWSRVLNATTGVCAVTASPTFTPGPCRATVDAAFETSVFQLMGWPLPVTRTTTRTVSSTPRATSTPKMTSRPSSTLRVTSRPLLNSTIASTSMVTSTPLRNTTTSRPALNTTTTSTSKTTSTPPPSTTTTSTSTSTTMTTPTPTAERKHMDNNNMLPTETESATAPGAVNNVATAAPMDPAMLPPGFVSLGASLSSLSGQHLILTWTVSAMLLLYF